MGADVVKGIGGAGTQTTSAAADSSSAAADAKGKMILEGHTVWKEHGNAVVDGATKSGFDKLSVHARHDYFEHGLHAKGKLMEHVPHAADAKAKAADNLAQ